MKISSEDNTMQVTQVMHVMKIIKGLACHTINLIHRRHVSHVGHAGHASHICYAIQSKPRDTTHAIYTAVAAHKVMQATCLNQVMQIT